MNLLNTLFIVCGSSDSQKKQIGVSKSINYDWYYMYRFRLVNSFTVAFLKTGLLIHHCHKRTTFSPQAAKTCSSKLGSTIRESSMLDMGSHLSWLNKIQAEEMVKLGSGVKTNNIVPFESRQLSIRGTCLWCHTNKWHSYMKLV